MHCFVRESKGQAKRPQSQWTKKLIHGPWRAGFHKLFYSYGGIKMHKEFYDYLELYLPLLLHPALLSDSWNPASYFWFYPLTLCGQMTKSCGSSNVDQNELGCSGVSIFKCNIILHWWDQSREYTRRNFKQGVDAHSNILLTWKRPLTESVFNLFKRKYWVCERCTHSCTQMRKNIAS